jgi:hypothetical protein
MESVAAWEVYASQNRTHDHGHARTNAKKYGISNKQVMDIGDKTRYEERNAARWQATQKWCANADSFWYDQVEWRQKRSEALRQTRNPFYFDVFCVGEALFQGHNKNAIVPCDAHNKYTCDYCYEDYEKSVFVIRDSNDLK